MDKYFFFGPMKVIDTLFAWARDFLIVVPNGELQKFINPIYVFMPIISINPFALSMIHLLTDNKILYEHKSCKKPKNIYLNSNGPQTH